MPVWLEKIELNQAIAKANDEYDLSRLEEPVPDAVKEQLAAVLKPSMWLSRFAAKIQSCKSIAELNRVLAQVYDAADRHRVWCGFAI